MIYFHLIVSSTSWVSLLFISCFFKVNIVFYIIFNVYIFFQIIYKRKFNEFDGPKEILDGYINEFFTIFDYTPITSMLLSFFRIFIAIFDSRENETQSYLSKSYIIQAINFAFYFLLLILMETGYLRNFLTGWN